MSANNEQKKKLIFHTVLFGAITAGLYAGVFMYADSVSELFSRGGYYAAFPIATVFVFSFFHGTFASMLWSVLGIEAVTKQAVKRPTVSVPRSIQRPRPRLRMNA